MLGETEGVVRLLDVDPSLARGVERRSLDAAREALTAEVRLAQPGTWEGAHDIPSSPLFLGYLILEGAFTREIASSGRPSLEILGPGDLVRPWVIPPELDAMHVAEEWALISEGRVAIIDEDFYEEAQPFPSVLTVMMDRVVARARWLGFQVALCQLPRIDHRLLLTFRYAAERWGVECADGVKLPIRLSHRNLAAMIGARRPKVSTAITALSDQGMIEQDKDGTWTFFAADLDPMEALAQVEDLP